MIQNTKKMHMEKTGCVSLSTILLTHWGRVIHIWVGQLTIIGSDNGLTPGYCQGINWTSAGILSMGPLGTNFSEISIGIQRFPFKKMHLKMSFAKWRPFSHCPNVLGNTLVFCSFHWIVCRMFRISLITSNLAIKWIFLWYFSALDHIFPFDSSPTGGLMQ